MGQCGSKVETKIPPGWMELFASLRLTKDEVRKLYSIFCKVDLDGSGSVDTVELLTLLDIERTRFTEQIFAVFDNDGSGKVDFREFVISLWNYCTIGKAALEIFTFDLYDSDSSGELSPGEISMMLKDIYGKNHMNDAKVKMIQAELHKIDTRARINLTAFKNFTQTHQGMLFPVFNLQHQLRCNVLGERFWDKASNRRLELSKGRYVTMSDLMLLHLNEGLYNRAVSDSNMMRMSSNARLVIKATGTNQRRQTTDAKYYTKAIGPPTSDSSAADDLQSVGPPPAADAPANATHSDKERDGASHDHSAGSYANAHHSAQQAHAGAASSASQSLAVQAQSSHNSSLSSLTHGFGSFLLGGAGGVQASKKSNHHGHAHGHGHRGSILKSTAAATAGSDIYFDNSGKCKPVHATGHHMHDVGAVNKRRNSVTPSG